MEKEQRKKLSRRIRIGLMATGLVAAIAIPVYAITTQSWVHPCADEEDLVCDTGCCPPYSNNCRCVGSWANEDHWTPELPGGIVGITHSHALVTDEEYIDMWYPDDGATKLTIKTKYTGGDDKLEVRFNSNYTLTLGGLVLDATNGEVTMLKDTGGTVETVY